ncbi:hypothetical protein GCM10010462_18230 [Microbacterium dextranolyticum]|uniref:Peptidase S11 D-alanyl-D-alanine carboxypeptidase A N-terminal domain-containing protein n=1 Tax=Microbacterium dextranolyticum TaxID=36806 RepID=A0A9W6M642_9MICO|nr:hypothetical protein GCM10017591_12820 [Microbacterium dextranolyticum]
MAAEAPATPAPDEGAAPEASPETYAFVTASTPRPSSRTALAWLDDDAVAATAAVPAALADAAPDLLARRPRRSPLRAGVVVPVLSVVGVVGAYAAATLLWPLSAVTPTVESIRIADISSPASAVSWPAEGSAAVGVEGFDAVASSTNDRAPIASISKVVTALMVLEQMPLSPGQSGPSFSFTSSDEREYNNYLAKDESALDVPVGGSLTQYQMLQGMLIGSAGNYTDRLASSIWPSDTVFAKAAADWLARHHLSGITMVEPTGIDPENSADPASLIALARLALADPVIAEIVKTPSVDLPGAGTVVNTNDLLSDPAVIGVKTGSLDTGYNLLAARQQTAGDATVRAYAVTLGQASHEERNTQTARLLDEVAAEASQPRLVPAGTLAGVVTTKWGGAANIVTDADASLLLWNGATAPVASDISLGDARTANAAVGTATATGPLGTTSTGLHLTGDLPDPDAWWRLTHPLELWGLAG